MKTQAGLVLASCVLAAPALADWDPGDGHKMHFPQLPDPNGWDISVGVPADDWQCSESGYVTDIHLWVSWRGDVEHWDTDLWVGIHENDTTGPYSKPGDPLWDGVFYDNEYTWRQWGTGDQGWYSPWTEEVIPHDHSNIFQINIEGIPDPFYQEEGETYWLLLGTVYGTWDLGWKTSQDHFEDGAVWYNPPDLGRNPNYPEGWNELRDPLTQDALDLAFVITPEPTALGLLLFGGLAVLRRRRA